MALGIIGIVVSLALLIFLAYRGWNVILIAPVLRGGGAFCSAGTRHRCSRPTPRSSCPRWALTSPKFFPLFLLGAIFGKLMDDSGLGARDRAQDRRLGRQGAVDARGRARLRAPHLRRRLALRGGLLGVSRSRSRCFARRQHPEALHPRRDRARFVHLHDDRAAGHAGDPERDPDPVLRHQHLRRAGSRHHRVDRCSASACCG